MSGYDCYDLKVEEYKKLIKKHKYNAQETIFEGIKFRSKKEAEHYKKLKLLENLGFIKDLEHEPLFKFIHNEILIGRFKPDFRFFDVRENRVRIQDVKGCKFGAAYQKFRSQCRLMKAFYNIIVEEI